MRSGLVRSILSFEALDHASVGDDLHSLSSVRFRLIRCCARVFSVDAVSLLPARHFHPRFFAKLLNFSPAIPFTGSPGSSICAAVKTHAARDPVARAGVDLADRQTSIPVQEFFRSGARAGCRLSPVRMTCVDFNSLFELPDRRAGPHRRGCMMPSFRRDVFPQRGCFFHQSANIAH